MAPDTTFHTNVGLPERSRPVPEQAYIMMKRDIADQLARGRRRVTVVPTDYLGCDAHEVKRALAELSETCVWPSRN